MLCEKNAIVMWRFENAPKELQALSNHGGDEDWVAIRRLDSVLETYSCPIFTEYCEFFGPCDTQVIQYDIYQVAIGAHA